MCNSQGQCPVNLASDLGQKDLLNYLPMEDKSALKQSPLHLAIEQGYGQVVAYLLRQRALGKFECDINAPDHQDRTPLFLAVAINNKQLVVLLLEKGAEL